MTDTPDTEYSAALALLPFTPELEAKIIANLQAWDTAEAAYDANETFDANLGADCDDARAVLGNADHIRALLNEIEQLRFAVATRDGLIKEYERQLAGKRREVAG